MVSRLDQMNLLTSIIVQLADMHSITSKEQHHEIYQITRLFMTKKADMNYISISEQDWNNYIEHTDKRLCSLCENILKQNHFFSQKELVTLHTQLQNIITLYDRLKQINKIYSFMLYTK